MSQQLSFTLKKKDDPNIKVELSWFSTTPSREIEGVNIFHYVEEDTKLTLEDFDKSILEIKEMIDLCKQNEDKCKERLESLTKLFASANTKSAEVILEEITEIQKSINSWQEDTNKWKYYETIIFLMREYAKSNEKEWDMYYINC